MAPAADAPRPHALWHQAEDEAHDGRHDRAWLRRRYLELMREHGHLVPASSLPERGRRLPCGWPVR